MRLTANDWRVLKAAEEAMATWGGVIPHGARDWMAIRRLEREKLILQSNDWADCKTCAEPHEGPSFAITVWGARALAQADEVAEARAYRTELRRRINGHKGVGKHTRPATARERILRASHVWLHEGLRDVYEDESWSVEDYIVQLVAHRYPEVPL
jgi:hypothetical protein